MKIHTESGSVWEIEPKVEGYRIRRLVNGMPAPDNVRATEGWRDALAITDIVVGRPIRISWRLRDGVTEATLTSNVISILLDTDAN